MLPGGWGQPLSVASIPMGHWQRLGLEGGRLMWQLVPWDRAGTNPVFSSSAKMLQGGRERGRISLNSLLTLKILGAPHREAAPMLAGEPSVLVGPQHHFQPHRFLPCLSSSDGLPHRAIFTGNRLKSSWPSRLWAASLAT